jgi:hypothetical protein
MAYEASKQRLLCGVAAVVTALLTLSVISFLLTTTAVSCALLQQNGYPLNASNDIWRHLYFVFGGGGDITFVNTQRGYIVGSVTAALVLLSVTGFVAYVNYYILSFKERLLAGLDTSVGVGTSAEWIAKNLKEV